MTSMKYSKTYSLPSTKAQVRRALQARFKNNEFKKGNILISGGVARLKMPSTLFTIQLERLLTLYYLQHNMETKSFFKHIWSL